MRDSKKQEDIPVEGAVKSVERISSNGNLSIYGDVNSGAIAPLRKIFTFEVNY